MKAFHAICLIISTSFLSFNFAQNIDSIAFENEQFNRVTANIHFVSTRKNHLVSKQVCNQLEQVFNKSKIAFKFIRQDYSAKNFPAVFSSPSGNKIIYTRQMRLTRDVFFSSVQEKKDNDYYIFIVDSFSDTNLLAYALPNKHVLFVKYSNLPNFSKVISSSLMRARGVSILSDTSAEALPNLSELLSWKECLELRKSNSFFQIHDDYEFVTSNNGLVAYYLWSEDKNGKIITSTPTSFLNDIVRPFKRNNSIVYLKIANPLFWPIYRSANWVISPSHVLVVLLVLFLLWYLRKTVNKRIVESKWYKRWLFRIFKFIMFFVSIGIVYGSFILVNKYYSYRFLENYQFSMFNNYSAQKVINGLSSTPELIKVPQQANKTEIFIKRGGSWVSTISKPVLYFDLITGKDGKTALYFRNSSANLSFNGKSIKALNHYFVITEKDFSGAIISKNLYDYQGKKIEVNTLNQNPTKRILLFVNGYRPVSTSSDLEKTFAAIQSKGLEMPETSNYIYDNDRFAYWTPWKKINYLFEDRIHPDDIYYADGHHSISTSDYVSILDFTNAMSFFPKQCKNLKKHNCEYAQNISNSKVKSKSILPTNPNESGFNLRRMHGRLAGYNLLQLLNNEPNSSRNDTLYIVAHSMGFAYSLGMSEVLVNKINFGGFYIIAPENARTGVVNVKLWKEVWQYGSKLTGLNPDPMCLQDGIAPQSNVKGLYTNNIIHFPKELDKKRGFSGSHFIGNYTWIFDLPQGTKGSVHGN